MNLISETYLSINKLDSAEFYIHKTIQKGISKLGKSHHIIANSYLILGNLHKSEGKFDESLNNYRVALNITSDTNSIFFSEIINNIGIKKKGKNRNGKEIIAAFLIPNLLIKVFVPFFLSASLSIMSLVMDPPIKNNNEISPIVIGKISKLLLKTLQDANIPKKPLGIATQI